MGLNKRLYVEYDTKINAENMNEIQDCIIANERKIQEIIDKTVGIYDTLGSNNELFNDVLSHVIEGDDSTKNNHLEGSGNKIIKAHKNYNNEGNHLEGYGHVGGGYCGHCENSSNQTYETNAHAGGVRSIASGAGTFSQGRGVISMGLGSAALGQSLFTDGSTTVLGLDGEETEIDWTTHPDETEQQRSKRIADRIEKLYLGTELKADGTPNTSVQRKFLASLGTGTIVGGVNCFGRGTANLVHGLGCYTLSSYCFSGGYSAKIGKNSDDCFAFGDNLIIEDNVKDAILFGTLNTIKAPYSFMAGYQNSNGTLAQYSFLLGTNSYINAPNSYGFGDHLSIGTKGQIVFGKYNDNSSTALFAIANGTESKRKNIFEIYSDKNVFQNKNVFYDELAFGKTLKSINCGNNAYNTIVMGLNCSNNDTADNSFTGGQNCQSQAKNAFTFGLNSYAAAENSAAIGEGIVVGVKDQFAVGKYNDNESKALFAVGGGEQGARKNSFEVFKDYVNINGSKLDVSSMLTSDKDIIFKHGNPGVEAISIKRNMSYDNNYIESYAIKINTRYGTTHPILSMNTSGLDDIEVGVTGYAALTLNPGTGNSFGYKYSDIPGGNLSNYLIVGKDPTDFVNLKNAIGNKSLFNVFASLINQANIKVTNEISNNTVTLQDGSNTQLLSSAINNLTLTFYNIKDGSTIPLKESETYKCKFSFYSGSTATVLNPPTGTNNTFYRTVLWSGDDCDTGVLVPKANKIYYVEVTNLGNNSDKSFISMNVKSYSYTAS